MYRLDIALLPIETAYIYAFSEMFIIKSNQCAFST